MTIKGAIAARYLWARTKWVRKRRGPAAAGQYILGFNASALSGAVVRCRRQGLEWELHPADVAQRTLYCLDSYEGPLRRLLVDAVEPGDTFLDVGAHVGMLACPVARRAGAVGGRVIAFEPAPDTAAKLRRNLELNGLDPVATVVQAGLSDAPGTAVLRGDPAFGPEGSSLRSLFGTGGGDADVELLRFDDWWEEHGRPRVDIVKMDVEGAEGQALRGMEQAIRACQPRMLVIEMKEHLANRAGGSASAVDELLGDLGYDRQPPISALLGNEPMPWLDENVIFTRKGSPMTSLTPLATPARAVATPTADRRRLQRLAMRAGGQQRLARRQSLRWWLVYGSAGSGARAMAAAIADNAKLAVTDRDRRGDDTSRAILAGADIAGGGALDLVYTRSELDGSEYDDLVAMWGPPERKVFCFREPALAMTAAMSEAPSRPRDVLQRGYTESLDRFWAIGGDAFELSPERTHADLVSFLAPLVPVTALEAVADTADDAHATPAMRAAYQAFVERLHGGGIEGMANRG